MTNRAERGSSSSGERRGRGLAAIHMSHWKYAFHPSSIAVFTPTHSTQAQRHAAHQRYVASVRFSDLCSFTTDLANDSFSLLIRPDLAFVVFCAITTVLYRASFPVALFARAHARFQFQCSVNREVLPATLPLDPMACVVHLHVLRTQLGLALWPVLLQGLDHPVFEVSLLYFLPSVHLWFDFRFGA
ncbi:hypothetical protein BJ912DRAFT_91535 [Pholiota molesta]|nr:hypothetical protein BJ912DRAFT_91535 [Pholiota molesta]